MEEKGKVKKNTIEPGTKKSPTTKKSPNKDKVSPAKGRTKNTKKDNEKTPKRNKTKEKESDEAISISSSDEELSIDDSVSEKLKKTKSKPIDTSKKRIRMPKIGNRFKDPDFRKFINEEKEVKDVPIVTDLTPPISPINNAVYTKSYAEFVRSLTEESDDFFHSNEDEVIEDLVLHDPDVGELCEISISETENDSERSSKHSNSSSVVNDSEFEFDFSNKKKKKKKSDKNSISNYFKKDDEISDELFTTPSPKVKKKPTKKQNNKKQRENNIDLMEIDTNNEDEDQILTEEISKKDLLNLEDISSQNGKSVKDSGDDPLHFSDDYLTQEFMNDDVIVSSNNNSSNDNDSNNNSSNQVGRFDLNPLPNNIEESRTSSTTRGRRINPSRKAKKTKTQTEENKSKSKRLPKPIPLRSTKKTNSKQQTSKSLPKPKLSENLIQQETFTPLPVFDPAILAAKISSIRNSASKRPYTPISLHVRPNIMDSPTENVNLPIQNSFSSTTKLNNENNKKPLRDTDRIDESPTKHHEIELYDSFQNNGSENSENNENNDEDVAIETNDIFDDDDDMDDIVIHRSYESDVDEGDLFIHSSEENNDEVDNEINDNKQKHKTKKSKDTKKNNTKTQNDRKITKKNDKNNNKHLNAKKKNIFIQNKSPVPSDNDTGMIENSSHTESISQKDSFIKNLNGVQDHQENSHDDDNNDILMNGDESEVLFQSSEETDENFNPSQKDGKNPKISPAKEPNTNLSNDIDESNHLITKTQENQKSNSTSMEFISNEANNNNNPSSISQINEMEIKPEKKQSEDDQSSLHHSITLQNKVKLEKVRKISDKIRKNEIKKIRHMKTKFQEENPFFTSSENDKITKRPRRRKKSSPATQSNLLKRKMAKQKDSFVKKKVKPLNLIYGTSPNQQHEAAQNLPDLTPVNRKQPKYTEKNCENIEKQLKQRIFATFDGRHSSDEFSEPSGDENNGTIHDNHSDRHQIEQTIEIENRNNENIQKSPKKPKISSFVRRKASTPVKFFCFFFFLYYFLLTFF